MFSLNYIFQSISISKCIVKEENWLDVKNLMKLKINIDNHLYYNKWISCRIEPKLLKNFMIVNHFKMQNSMKCAEGNYAVIL